MGGTWPHLPQTPSIKIWNSQEWGNGAIAKGFFRDKKEVPNQGSVDRTLVPMLQKPSLLESKAQPRTGNLQRISLGE